MVSLYSNGNPNQDTKNPPKKMFTIIVLGLGDLFLFYFVEKVLFHYLDNFFNVWSKELY